MDGGAILSVTADGAVVVAEAGVGEPSVVLQKSGAGNTYALGFAAGGRLVYGVTETTVTNQDDVIRVTNLTARLWQAAPARPSTATSCRATSGRRRYLRR